jgi:hypothetical protein
MTPQWASRRDAMTKSAVVAAIGRGMLAELVSAPAK